MDKSFTSAKWLQTLTVNNKNEIHGAVSNSKDELIGIKFFLGHNNCKVKLHKEVVS